MPFVKNTIRLIDRDILVEPEYGYGWLLIGKTSMPFEIEVPASFKSLASNILYESGVAYGLVTKCKLELSGELVYWVGLIPRVDAEIDLTLEEADCNVILSPTPPRLTRQNEHPRAVYLSTESKVFFRGSARIVLVPK